MIEIICIRGEGDVRAPDVQDPLISNEFIAVKRGTSVIDETWYRKHARNILVPYKDDCFAGRVVSVTDGHLNISGNHVITGHRIRVSKEGIWSEMRIEQHSEGG